MNFHSALFLCLIAYETLCGVFNIKYWHSYVVIFSFSSHNISNLVSDLKSVANITQVCMVKRSLL